MARIKQNPSSAPLIGVITARYSSHNQRDVSIEQQVAECKAFAAANNIEISAVYADRGLTGRNDKRPEFQRMIRHAEKKQFEVIVAYKSDRMSRNMLNALMYEEKLKQLGIKVVYVKEEFGNSAAGRFSLRTMMNVNQFYSENLSENIKRGMAYNAQNCLVTGGTAPLGYKTGEDGKYAIDQPKAAIVKEIFTRVALDEPFVDIASDLNMRGIKTRTGGRWGRTSFQGLIRNERYTGVFLYGDVRVEGGMPQIIEKELFLKVQEHIQNKPNPQGRHRVNGDYYLTGKLFCGHCSSPMGGDSGTGKLGKLHYYYSCQKKRFGKTCSKNSVRRDWVEYNLAAAIQRYIMDDDVVRDMTDFVIDYAKKYKDRSEIPLIEKQLADVRKSIKNLMAAMLQGIVTPTTKSYLEELEAEQTKLSNRLITQHADVLNVARADILDWFDSLRHGDVNDKEHQKKLFDNFLIAAYVYDDHFKIAFNHTGKRTIVKVPFALIDSIEEQGRGVRLSSSPLRH